MNSARVGRLGYWMGTCPTRGRWRWTKIIRLSGCSLCITRRSDHSSRFIFCRCVKFPQPSMWFSFHAGVRSACGMCIFGLRFPILHLSTCTYTCFAGSLPMLLACLKQSGACTVKMSGTRIPGKQCSTCASGRHESRRRTHGHHTARRLPRVLGSVFPFASVHASGRQFQRDRMAMAVGR